MFITEDSEQIEHPQGFQVTLFPYQLATVYAMEQLERKKISWVSENGNVTREGETRVGFLANKVGSGKTNVLLALAQRNTVSSADFTTEMSVQSSMSDAISVVTYVKVNTNRPINTTLIIVPHTIVSQWISEINKTSIKYILVKNLDDVVLTDDISVVLCASTKFSRFYDKFHQIVWNRVIIDEVGSISHCKPMMKFNFLWCVSATCFKDDYYGIHASMRSIQSKFFRNFIDTTDNEILEHIRIQCDERYIDKYVDFSASIERHYIACEQDRILRRISSLLSPEIQRMISGDDIAGAMAALGGSSANEDSIVDLISKKIKNEIDDTNSKILYTRSLTSLSAHNKQKSIEKDQEKIKSLETRLQSITDTIHSISTESCAICMDNYTRPVLVSCCNNVFCFDCITQAFKVKQQCVLCRQKIDFSNLTHISSTSSTATSSTATSSSKQSKKEPDTVTKTMKKKEDTCIDIILKNSRNKILVFSDYDGTFTNLKTTLRQKSIGTAELKGSCEEIPRIVKNFNTGKFNVLLLNSKYAGSGINLEKTTDIIVYHKTHLETQIIGRALRANRNPKLKLNIHYLQYEHEN